MPKSQGYTDSWKRTRPGARAADFDVVKEREFSDQWAPAQEREPGQPGTTATGNSLRDYINRMREQGKTPTFSNIQDSSAFAGMPEEDVYTDPEYREGAMGGMTPLRERPPDDYKAPDFSKRDLFEKNVFETIGGNPYEINVVQELENSINAEMPQLFEEFFRGQVIWEDQDKLNSDQQEAWDEALKRYRAEKKEMIMGEKDAMHDRYTQMMNMFDHQAKVTMQRRKEEGIKTRETIEKLTEADKKKKADLEKNIEKHADLVKERSAARAEFLQMGEGEITDRMKAEYEPYMKTLDDQIARLEKKIGKQKPQATGTLDRDSVRPFIKQAIADLVKQGKSKEWIRANKQQVKGLAQGLAQKSGYK